MAEQKDERREIQPPAGGAVFSQTCALTTRWTAGVSTQSASLSAVQLVTTSETKSRFVLWISLFDWRERLFSDCSPIVLRPLCDFTEQR